MGRLWSLIPSLTHTGQGFSPLPLQTSQRRKISPRPLHSGQGALPLESQSGQGTRSSSEEDGALGSSLASSRPEASGGSARRANATAAGTRQGLRRIRAPGSSTIKLATPFLSQCSARKALSRRRHSSSREGLPAAGGTRTEGALRPRNRFFSSINGMLRRHKEVDGKIRPGPASERKPRGLAGPPRKSEESRWMPDRRRWTQMNARRAPGQGRRPPIEGCLSGFQL